MLIVTNFERFPASWKAAGGLTGASVSAHTPDQFRSRRGADVIWLVNCDTTLTLRLGAYKAFAPHAAALIGADLVLRAPKDFRGRLALPAKRFLFGRVDHFIHYFRDLSGFHREFGIGPDRSSFVPFKVNLRHLMADRADPSGGYILCLGRSMRDFDTFFDAMEQLPYPAAITQPDVALFQRHGARFTRPLNALPQNVRVLPDDGGDDAMVRIVRGARLVVMPVLKSSMVASGISTALNAMALGKCVIGSQGPGMSDVFENEVLVAPPEDPQALAAVVRRAWEDDPLRLSTAEAGWRYARQAGGEDELYQRIVDRIAAWRLSQCQGGPAPEGQIDRKMSKDACFSDVAG